ncbi:MAG: cytochrome ubiquinol oxidase subunit I [Halothiobacillaceae bacterium]
MELDPLFLSRLQFAFVVSFHAIFPVFTIGLASFIAVLKLMYVLRGNPVFDELSVFWTRVFAVVFGMGVVSGIVMSFQFGTNWSVFSYAAANFIGPVISYEVLTAFFLEAVFLGVLLFGRDRVPAGVHLFAAVMVAVGTMISSFWILSVNSWMQTPAGVRFEEGLFHVQSWSEAIFNPSLAHRLPHVLLASFLTGAVVVLGVSAWFLRQGRQRHLFLPALRMAVVMLAVAAPLQLLVGDAHGRNTLAYQPEKIAAIEGIWETERGVPLLLFAIPDQDGERNLFEVGIPRGASLILTHDPDGALRGLKEWPAAERPPVFPVFWSFRVMVGIGLVLIVLGAWGLWRMARGRLGENGLYLRLASWSIPLPFIAVLAGWFVTEIGRQPWVVYGLMDHAAALTPSLSGPMALTSLVGYALVYALVFVTGLSTLRRVIMAGPEAGSGGDRYAHAKRPLAMAGQTDSTRETV